MSAHLQIPQTRTLPVKGLAGVQAASLSQPSALGFLGQRELGAREALTSPDHRLEQAALPRRADVGEEFAQMKARPCVVEDGQAAIIQGVVKLHRIGWQEVLAFEGGRDDLARRGGQIGDYADGAGTGPSGVRKDSRTR